MLYLYLASIFCSYFITKSNITKFENKLKETNLNTEESFSEKNNKNIVLLVISCIPLINLILIIMALISEEYLYNIYKEAQCQLIIQDNEELLTKYEKACNSKNDKTRRRLEQEISLMN